MTAIVVLKCILINLFSKTNNIPISHLILLLRQISLVYTMVRISFLRKWVDTNQNQAWVQISSIGLSRKSSSPTGGAKGK